MCTLLRGMPVTVAVLQAWQQTVAPPQEQSAGLLVVIYRPGLEQRHCGPE